MIPAMPRMRAVVAAFLFVALTSATEAQWSHRYSKLDDFNHHTYLEQHELPVLTHGPSDPAPAPDGRRLAFAAQGWLWVLDLESGRAERLTNGPHLDARPRWSPDGQRLAFVRDSGESTWIVVRDLLTDEDTVITSPDSIFLDPEFSADGTTLFYTAVVDGSLELTSHDLDTGIAGTLTDLPQVVRNARRLPDGEGLVYLHGDGAHRVLRERDFESGEDRIAHAETLTYHLTADVHPIERLIVYSAPIDNDYHLWTMDLDDPRVRHRLTEAPSYAMTPAFGADGRHIYYVEADPERRFELKRIPTHGGPSERIDIVAWDHGMPTGTLNVAIRASDGSSADDASVARVSIIDDSGHPVAHPDDATFFDSQSGRYYFYIDGQARFTLPVGRYTVLAARGPMSVPVERQIEIVDAGLEELSLRLEPFWNAAEAGYASADHHVHLNGDGHFRADHDDALRAMAGEDLDVLAPMSWNRWERRIDAPLVGDVSRRGGRVVRQGQEVRSHFHGHIGLLGVETPFAPWFFGPSNPVLGDPDLTNGDVIAFAEARGAFPTYVHPIGGDRDSFGHLADGPIPIELISDGVLAERMGIELVCAWTSPLGNAHVWYRLLNVGRPVAAMSGTDGWVDFHRTPAMGTGRNYVRTEAGTTDPDAVLAAAADGRGFLTTGPVLLLELDDGTRPGDVTASGRRGWKVTLASINAVDTLELLVNGRVVETLPGVEAGGRVVRQGSIELPDGGWVAARAYASEPPTDNWPTMHARPFAHASPIWINEVGSTEAEARAVAAADLIRAIDAAEAEARSAYGEQDMPRLYARFERARQALRPMTERGAEAR